MNKRKVFGLVVLLIISQIGLGQTGYWQQRVEYSMNINMDVDANQFSGTQTLKYFNNSPDTLNKVFFHLYFNAFQPGSMMDVRSRTISDPSRKIKDRIYHLQEDEIGYHHIKSLKQEGKKLAFEIEGTVMEVPLIKPLLPGKSTVFNMKFDSQVPVQIRRSGRDNKEGIRFSMAQWFPKIAEYDRGGWNAHPYIAREFYSPWGDYEVNITIDKSYTVAATGYLQNPNEIGHGYDQPNSGPAKDKGGKLTYRFKAENVHDFVWAADPDYVHDVVMVDDITLHYFYQADTLVENWKLSQTKLQKAFPFIEKNFGKYPYKKYSFIQGGDGGMEYPMATLINGHRSERSLTGVSVHELMHNWYQMLLATNESYHSWMDEGFTSYATGRITDYLYNENYPSSSLNKGRYKSYVKLVESGLEEPMTTHADHYNTNSAYSMAAYTKGALALDQLDYIMGTETFEKGLLRYFNEWKFRHPTPIDFERVMEKESGLELSWFFDYWVGTTKYIDYGVKQAAASAIGTKIVLERNGKMPMPLDVQVTLKDGTVKNYYMALGVMRGEKKLNPETIQLSDWPWVNPTYSFEVPFDISQIDKIEIDSSGLMADVDRKNNVYPLATQTVEMSGVPKVTQSLN